MKNIYIVFTLLSLLCLEGHAQITFRGCTGAMGSQDFVLTNTDTNTDAGIVRNTYESTPLNFGQSCPAGVCEMRIIWNDVADRWEMQLDNDGPVNMPNYSTGILYFSTTASHPNPPDISSGNWQSAGFCPDAISTMSGDVDDGTTLGLTTLDVENKIIKIYPNPTKGILKIKSEIAIKKITIHSIIGAKIFTTSELAFDVSNLQTGIYMMNIETINGDLITKRIIKQ
ncbi:T9SS type A sorting domain-containing protein [Kordia sp.]|uniref:T9SS type A sorting domain-containing protein n=1 Tax=Kordia sp. TaxID=1965332 RepID=UPI003D29CA07